MNDSSRPSDRRRFLTAVGTGSLVLSAGCTGQLPGGAEESGEGEPDTETANENSSEDENGDEEDARPPAISHGEFVSDFDEDLDEWFALEGEIAADDEEFLTGSQTLRIENTDATAGISRSFPDGLDIENHHLSLALRVDHPRPARVTVRLLAPGQSDQVWSTRTVLSSYEGWLRMDLGYSGQRGEPFFDNVQEIQITLDDPANSPGGDEDNGDDGNDDNGSDEDNSSEDDEELSLQRNPVLQIESDEDAEEGTEDTTEGDEGIRFWVDDFRMTPTADQGYVMLTFDDNTESQYENAFPIFEERDMQGVLAVIPPTLNRPGRLSVDQLREMRDAGWDVSAHAERSEGLADMDPQEAREALESDQEYLINRGFPEGARFHTVPYHNVNQEVTDIAREYYEMNSYFGGTPNAVPLTDPMHLSRVDMHDLEGFMSMIDLAEEHNQLAIGLAHGVQPEADIDDEPLADMTTEQLEELLNYIEESDVQLVTASDLIDAAPDDL